MKYLKFFKPWKIVYFFGLILSLPGIFITPPHVENGLANRIISFILFLILVLSPFLPDLLYLKTPAAKLWKRWEDVEGKRAEDRKDRAYFGELTPVHIDPELKYGTFAGSTGGKYRTTLRKCSCPDFQKRKVPCKHMYYLAYKCGVENLTRK